MREEEEGRTTGVSIKQNKGGFVIHAGLLQGRHENTYWRKRTEEDNFWCFLQFPISEASVRVFSPKRKNGEISKAVTSRALPVHGGVTKRLDFNIIVSPSSPTLKEKRRRRREGKNWEMRRRTGKSRGYLCSKSRRREEEEDRGYLPPPRPQPRVEERN